MKTMREIYVIKAMIFSIKWVSILELILLLIVVMDVLNAHELLLVANFVEMYYLYAFYLLCGLKHLQ